jgi:hypothetical protein
MKDTECEECKQTDARIRQLEELNRNMAESCDRLHDEQKHAESSRDGGVDNPRDRAA